jgi:urease accessory protein
MRALEVLPAGSWDAGRQVDEVLIDYDRRFRRRILLVTVSGQEVLIDQPVAVRLREGDGLAIDGGVVAVRAKPEACMDIHAHEEGALIRVVWHLGNRHLPVQLLGDVVRIRADHVIRDMVEGLGGHVDEVDAPFDPEAGAYAGGHHHHHDDDDDHHHH